MMKVVTPIMKPKSVSKQIQSQFTPVNTPDPEKDKHKKSPRPPRFSKSHSPTMSSFKPILSESPSSDKLDLETIIDGKSDKSPLLPRSGKFDWDSHGEESPTIRRKTSAYSVTQQRKGSSSPLSNPPAGSWRSKSTSNLFPSEASSTSRISNSPPLSAFRGNISEIELLKSRTLPIGLTPKLLDYADSDSDEESEEDSSSFASALRESREKMKRNSSLRVDQRSRSNTMPSPTPPQKGSPLLVKHAATEEKMSPLQMEILKASQQRSNRISKQQSRLTDVQKKENKDVERNSLAEVLSRRLDSMNAEIKPHDQSDDSFDDSPGLPSKDNKNLKGSQAKVKSESYISDQSRIAPSKAPPPSIKPKPSKKDRQERSSSPVVNRQASSSYDLQERETASPTLPWEVKLRSALKKNPESAKTMVNEGVDWKCVLKTGSGRGSPVLMEPKKTSSSSNDGREETSPLSHVVTKEPSPSGFVLPPPLPDSSKRLSFVEVDPPEGFSIEMDETSTDVLFNMPPLEVRGHVNLSKDNVNPPSPVPPPLPESSPPPKLYSGSGVFIFPEVSVKGNVKSVPLPVPSPVQTPDLEDLPSPIPSPLKDGVFTSAFSISPLPPPVFEQTDGFWIDDEPDALPPPRPPSPKNLVLSPESENIKLPPPLPSEPPPPPPSDPPPPLPSDSPPPLPSSEPPLLLDSDDTSFEATVSASACDDDLNEQNVIQSGSSSPGSSPQSYDVAEAHTLISTEMLPREVVSKEMVSRETVSGEMVSRGRSVVEERKEVEVGVSVPKVVPLVAKKPKRGFPIPSPEVSHTCYSYDVTVGDKKIQDCIAHLTGPKGNLRV